MEIDEIKLKMKNYIDFYGGSLIGLSNLDKCKTYRDLAELIKEHYDHLESQCNDAQHSLERFQQSLGLHNLD